MLIGPVRLMECIMLAAIVASITLIAARLDRHEEAMAKCQERHSFATCHSALNR